MSRRSSMAFQALSNLDKYVEEELIGQGSFGIIHKVRRKSDGKLFAQKRLNFSKMTTRDKQQLVAEVNILNKLQHPHIVGYEERILDAERGIIYLIIEYCGGGDLSHLVRECERTGRQIPEDQIWDYFCQIVQALDHCHAPERDDDQDAGRGGPASGTRRKGSTGAQRERVLHRDLKPDNVFLDDTKENVKLGDFGLSKAMGAAAFANTYVGTPYYMSPELFNESAYDAKSDIWALGCVIYELVALHPPFHQAKTHNDLANQLRSQRIPPLPRKVDPNLSQVIMKMLSFDPKQRPSTADLLQHPMMLVHRKMQGLNANRQLLSQRATQLGEREASLVARELAVLEREERCSSQERKVNALRRGLEGERELLKLERARWEDERRGSSAMSAASVGSSSTGSSSTSTHSTAVEMDVDNTVMPRPTGSKVPRRSFTTRPLEERFSTDAGPTRAPNIPVPTQRGSRDSGMFDVVSTPTKSAFLASGLPPTSIRRVGGTPSRLASKSMGNLAAVARADRARYGDDSMSGGSGLDSMAAAPLHQERRQSNHRASVGSPGEASSSSASSSGQKTTSSAAFGRPASTVGTSSRRPSPTLTTHAAANAAASSTSAANSNSNNPFGATEIVRGDRDAAPPSRQTRPPLPPSTHSMPTSMLPTSISTANLAPAVTTTTSSSVSAATAPEKPFPNTPARWDRADMENLPSPFLKAGVGAPHQYHHHAHHEMANSALAAPPSRGAALPRSRSNIGLSTPSREGGSGDRGGGATNLARLAMAGHAKEQGGNGGTVRTESILRPGPLQRVSRASTYERASARESLARAEAAVGDAQRAMSG